MVTYVLIPHSLPPLGPLFGLLSLYILLEYIELVFVERWLFGTYFLLAITFLDLLLHPEFPAAQGGAHLRDC